MKHTTEQLFQMFKENRIPFAPIYNISSLMIHPHLQEWGFWTEAEHPRVGRLKYPEGVCKFSRSTWQIERPAPLLGEHNELILCEWLGYSKEEVVNLKKEEII